MKVSEVDSQFSVTFGLESRALFPQTFSLWCIGSEHSSPGSNPLAWLEAEEVT